MKTSAINYDSLREYSINSFNEALKNADKRKLAENLAYLIALETGLRVGDLLRLRFDSFNYSNDLGKPYFESPIKKTKQAHTGIISDEVYNKIEQYRKALISLNINPEANLFHNYQGKNIYTRQWMHKQFKIVGSKLGFEDFGVHSIRKASAIRVLDLTGSLSMAQYHLTHKRASTTDLYLNVSKKTALEQLSKLF